MNPEKPFGADFKFQSGDELILKRPENRISPHKAIVGKLGIGPEGLAYQLYFDRSEQSGKFFPKDEVEGQFKILRKVSG